VLPDQVTINTPGLTMLNAQIWQAWRPTMEKKWTCDLSKSVTGY